MSIVRYHLTSPNFRYSPEESRWEAESKTTVVGGSKSYALDADQVQDADIQLGQARVLSKKVRVRHTHMIGRCSTPSDDTSSSLESWSDTDEDT